MKNGAPNHWLRVEKLPVWKLLVCGLLTLGWHLSAHAWGDEGHRITGFIANTYLSDAARAQLLTLVSTDNLALIATWMDDERDLLNQSLPGSSRWHYENRLACAPTLNAAPPCPQGQCITQQIERWSKVLQNRDESVAHRADAVRILVHLIGDLHQPLHLIDNNDRGGNDVLVRLPRQKEPRRLHEVWDARVLHSNLRRRGTESYARILDERFATQRVEWQRGTVEDWARETHLLGRDAYQRLPNFACRSAKDPAEAVTDLPLAYIDAAKPIIDTQLAKAGMRMAWILNAALTAAPARPLKN
jgi:hypothetical protein